MASQQFRKMRGHLAAQVHLVPSQLIKMLKMHMWVGRLYEFKGVSEVEFAYVGIVV